MNDIVLYEINLQIFNTTLICRYTDLIQNSNSKNRSRKAIQLLLNNPRHQNSSRSRGISLTHVSYSAYDILPRRMLAKHQTRARSAGEAYTAIRVYDDKQRKSEDMGDRRDCLRVSV